MSDKFDRFKEIFHGLLKYLDAFSKLRKKQLLASSYLSVCLSVRMEQSGSRRKDFNGTGYRSILGKPVETVYLKRITDTSQKDLRTFTMYVSISLNSS